MNISQAIMALSQSEKLKTGVIWITHVLNLIDGLPPEEKKGGQHVVGVMISMIGQELQLAKRVAQSESWDEIQPYLDKAALMINSGVAQEAHIHLSQALSRITTVGQRAMTVLQEHHSL